VSFVSFFSSMFCSVEHAIARVKMAPILFTLFLATDRMKRGFAR
jgi:hypothetical protein